MSAAMVSLIFLASCAGPEGSSDTGSSSENGDSAKEIYRKLATENGADEIAVPRDPEEAYALRLSEFGQDYSECGQEVEVSGQTCEKPTSLEERELKENINVELILDASGSMQERSGGERKIDIAKRALVDFVATLPDTANVSLRVYGHVGTSEESDRELSCRSSESILSFQRLDRQKFTDAVNSFEPSGWTPVAGSLEAARQDFSGLDPEINSNFVYLVSDGVETCGGDPAAAARGLASQDIRAEVNIIGFDVNPKAARQLKRAARSGGGEYYEASDADELNEVFQDRFDWTEWTSYYNCIEGNAYGEYNAETGAAFGNYNCLTAKAFREYNVVTADAYARYNEISGAEFELYNEISSEVNAGDGYEKVRDEVLDLAAKRRDGRIEAAAAERDYTVEKATEQRDGIVEPAKAERDTEVQAALEERETILKSVEEERN